MFSSSSVLLAFGLWWGSSMLPLIVGLVVPGRKGTMRTTRSIKLHPIPIEDAYALVLSRVEQHGFKLKSAEPPHHFKAVTGPANMFSNPDQVNAHKPLGVEAQLTVEQDGTVVQLSVWMRDLVFLDTGEGRHVDMVLDRLLSADTETPSSAPSTNISYWAFSAVTGGLAGTGLLLARLLVPDLVSMPDVAFAHGLGLTGGWVNCAAGIGLWSIHNKGGQITGRPMAVAALGLGMALILFATLWAR